MKKGFGSDDDDDDDSSRPSPLLQTQRFTKSGTVGTKDLKVTQSKLKYNEPSSLKINLQQINDEEDSLNDSDDDTNTKTGRSTSSGTLSQLTPKPKERSFLKKDTERPKIKPRHIDIDEDERNVFGQATMKPSPRAQILTIREEEARDQSFMQGFSNERKRQSPTDIFSVDHKPDLRRNSRKSLTAHEDKEHIDSDDDTLSNKQLKQNGFQKSRQSPTNKDELSSRRNSNKTKEGIHQIDHHDDHSFKQSERQDFKKPRQSTHDLTQSFQESRHSPTHRDELQSRHSPIHKDELQSRHSPIHRDELQSRKNTNKSRDGSDQSDNDADHSFKQPKRQDFTKQKQSTHDSSQNFQQSRRSPTHIEELSSRRNSNRSKQGSDQSDNDDDHLFKQSKRQDFTKQKQSTQDSVQPSSKDIDLSAIQHQSSSSRPGSAGKKEVESARRSSYCEDQDTVIPPMTNQKTQSRPTSAKSNTTRQQTQSAIDTVTSANTPHALDPLTSNNEALAAALQPPPPPRPSAKLPPRPKPSFNRTTTTTTGGPHKKSKHKVPSQYQQITSRVDTGRTSFSATDLNRSVERAMNKALKSQTLPKPQSARARTQSATSNASDRSRRRSSSAYEHVKPRVNTNLSINFDELNTSQMQGTSSQSIKDGVYLEWLKTKEEQKNLEKKELKHWKEEKAKRIDRSKLEREISQEAQKLERWRQQKDEETRQKKRQELELKREQEEKKKQDQQQKKKFAEDGFGNWMEKKKDDLQTKKEEEQNKKMEIEKRQEEKQQKVFKAAEAYEKWDNKKKEQIKKQEEAKKKAREDQLKKIRENEETKFVSAQEAYENWLKDKDKFEIDEKINAQRRNSLAAKQPQAPFLPGGGQRNKGKIQHVAW